VCSWSDELDWSEKIPKISLYADDRNFYKLEKWTTDGTRIVRLPYAGNNLKKAHKLFAGAIKHRPRIRLTILRRIRVLRRWPTP
jgi:hypothetical protein